MLKQPSKKWIPESYEYEYYCRNCSCRTNYCLEKGTLITDYNFTCYNCGCTSDQVAAYNIRLAHENFNCGLRNPGEKLGESVE